MAVQIGGEKAYITRTHGDLGVSFQWLNNEPAMFLFPAHRGAGRAGAFVIPLESAHKYVRPNGHPNVEYVTEQAAVAAGVMGMPITRDTLRKVLDVIADGMPDLIAMPPEPVSQIRRPEPVGGLTVKVDGETVHEREV